VTVKFPVPIVQNCIKVSLEEPKDIKLSLHRNFIPEKSMKIFYETSTDVVKRVSLAISFFHGLINERTRFKNMGWNQPYIFPKRDLELAVGYLHNYMAESEPAGSLAEMATFISSCIYGSCMEDKLDANTLCTILRRFCNEALSSGDKNELDSDGTYNLSIYSTYEEFLEYIQQLPEQSTREMLKMEPPLYNQQSLSDTENFQRKLKLTENLKSEKERIFSVKQIQEEVETILQKLPGTLLFLRYNVIFINNVSISSTPLFLFNT
jgi:dynein heavy chain, axonemal